ncbi:MAG TPA: MFS transporter [Vicinamibacterales bacterium]|nr:MFS transporter [Vicinamibacterales bacterium]
MTASGTGSPSSSGFVLARRAAYYGLAVITLLNFVNYIDRYILAAVMPRIKTDLGLSDFELGLLTNGFLISYFLTSPFFGRLGDRLSRTKLISAGVAAWSVATAASGLAATFPQLFAARATVGVGEAAYATISPSLLSDYFPKPERGRAFATFYVALPVGAAIGFLLGGAIEHAYGWRAAFYAVGLPGLALALLTLTAPEPPRGIQDDEPVPVLDESIWQSLRTLVRIPDYVWTVAGYAAYTFGVGGLAIWMPTYLSRVRGLELREADFLVGGVTVIAGLAGTFIGGFLGDRLLRRTDRAYLWLSGVAALLGIVPTWIALTAASEPLYIGGFLVAEFLLFLSTGPINVVIISAVPVAMRATAMAVSIFAIHLFGDAISPPIIGAIADHIGLAKAVLVVPVAVAICGIVWTGIAGAGGGSRTARAGP